MYYLGPWHQKEVNNERHAWGDKELDELPNNQAKLAEVLDKKPPAPNKGNPSTQSGNKETATMAREPQKYEVENLDTHTGVGENAREYPNSQTVHLFHG